MCSAVFPCFGGVHAVLTGLSTCTCCTRSAVFPGSGGVHGIAVPGGDHRVAVSGAGAEHEMDLGEGSVLPHGLGDDAAHAVSGEHANVSICGLLF